MYAASCTRACLNRKTASGGTPRWNTRPASTSRRSHLRHITELGDILLSMGRTPPKEGDMKPLLTKGKVVIAGLMGDEAILQAMRTNEADTNTAYERAVNFKDLQANTRDVLQNGLADERRHGEWIWSS